MDILQRDSTRHQKNVSHADTIKFLMPTNACKLGWLVLIVILDYTKKGI